LCDLPGRLSQWCSTIGSTMDTLISNQYTTPSAHHLQDGLKLPKSLHQYSLSKDQTILSHKILIITHYNLYLYYLYRAFHNVLQDYKHLFYETRRIRIYETCTDKKNNSKILFPVSFFFIVVHISAARRCECM